MSNITATADGILAAMHRMWSGADHRTAMARRFAQDRGVLAPEEARAAYPMGISQAMAANGWTVQSFTRALY